MEPTRVYVTKGGNTMAKAPKILLKIRSFTRLHQ